jgi:hypothetical protein
MSLTTKPPRLFHEDRGAGEPFLMISGFGLSSAAPPP